MSVLGFESPVNQKPETRNLKTNSNRFSLPHRLLRDEGLRDSGFGIRDSGLRFRKSVGFRASRKARATKYPSGGFSNPVYILKTHEDVYIREGYFGGRVELSHLGVVEKAGQYLEEGERVVTSSRWLSLFGHTTLASPGSPPSQRSLPFLSIHFMKQASSEFGSPTPILPFYPLLSG